MSYYSAEWLPKDTVEQIAGKQGKARVKKFMEKPHWDIQWSEEEPFNPSFSKIDRVIDEGEMEGEVYYLVKWGSLSYDECTWEPQDVVEQLDSSKIDEFYDRRHPTEEKILSYTTEWRRPHSSEWRKMNESPEYKNNNQLRSYQLEGLNWLLYWSVFFIYYF